MKRALVTAALAMSAVVTGTGCVRVTVTRPPGARSAEAYVPTVRERAFLDTLSRRTFDFFWETTNPRNGLTPDRWPTPSFSSVAA
ncbi:MAG: Tat pathway signal protein, partial [Gemmatimonadaceae bacterium]